MGWPWYLYLIFLLWWLAWSFSSVWLLLHNPFHPIWDIFNGLPCWVLWDGRSRLIWLHFCFWILCHSINFQGFFGSLWLHLLLGFYFLVLWFLRHCGHIYIRGLCSWLLNLFQYRCGLYWYRLWGWDFVDIDELQWLLFTFFSVSSWPGLNSGLPGGLAHFYLLRWFHVGEFQMSNGFEWSLWSQWTLSMFFRLCLSLSVLSSLIDYWLPHPCVVWLSHEACRGWFLDYGFNAP